MTALEDERPAQPLEDAGSPGETPLPAEAAQQLPAELAAPGSPPPPPLYPVTLDFTAPDRDLSRLSTFFRLILMIPLLVFVAIIGSGFDFPSSGGDRAFLAAGSGASGSLLIAHWLSILVRKRPVTWIWGTLVAIERFVLRSYSYVLLITDRYPAFEGDWYLQYEVARPERISRRQLFFWKLFTSIPHFIVLAAIGFAVAVCTVVGWFAILFTGRYPSGLRDLVVGWLRWTARVTAYFFSLRDEFPPYSLSAQAGPGSRQAQLFSGLGGIALIVLAAGAAAVIFLALFKTESVDVDYQTLATGSASETLDVDNVRIMLSSADDSYSFPDDLYEPHGGHRFVAFTVELRNEKITELHIDSDDFELDGEDPILLSVNAEPPPVELREGTRATAVVVFEVEGSSAPDELSYWPDPGTKKAKFVFH